MLQRTIPTRRPSAACSHCGTQLVPGRPPAKPSSPVFTSLLGRVFLWGAVAFCVLQIAAHAWLPFPKCASPTQPVADLCGPASGDRDGAVTSASMAPFRDSVELFEKLWPDLGRYMMMSKAEAHMVCQYLQPSHRMLEWGSGGSTTLFSQFVGLYDSIEHDQPWFKFMAAERIPELTPPGRVQYKFVSAHEGFKWGGGLPSAGANYVEYVLAPPEGVRYNRIIVDGRARPQCAIEALRHLAFPEEGGGEGGAGSANGSRADYPLVFLHDFWAGTRPHYHLVFQFYDLVDSHCLQGSQTIVVLRPKPDWRERVAAFPFPDWWMGDASDGSVPQDAFLGASVPLRHAPEVELIPVLA